MQYCLRIWPKQGLNNFPSCLKQFSHQMLASVGSSSRFGTEPNICSMKCLLTHICFYLCACRYPDYEFISDNSISWSAGLHNRYTENSLRGVILDIHFLSRTNFLVCTFSSQVQFDPLLLNCFGSVGLSVTYSSLCHFAELIQLCDRCGFSCMYTQ